MRGTRNREQGTTLSSRPKRRDLSLHNRCPHLARRDTDPTTDPLNNSSCHPARPHARGRGGFQTRPTALPAKIAKSVLDRSYMTEHTLAFSADAVTRCLAWLTLRYGVEVQLQIVGLRARY